MLRPRYSANGMFIGVAEEEIKFKVDFRIMQVNIDVDKFSRESYPAFKSIVEGAKDEIPTEIYQKLLKGNKGYKNFGIMVDLIFTNRQSWEKLGQKSSIEIIKVLNLAKDRSERTILEVKIEGIEKSMVLKCVECEANDISTGRVLTLAQKEIIAYDALPTHLRDIFVEKYAHGRLWFDNSSYEVILMEQMSGPDLYTGLMQIKHKKDNIEQFVWLAKAVKLLHRIHIAGFFHGDAHTGNLMWSDGNGKGALKFLDPERMVNMNVDRCDNTTKAIRKMCDLSQIFFFNPMSVYSLTPPRRIEKINFKLLNARLKYIRNKLTERSQYNFFPLDELFPYDTAVAYTGISDINRIRAQLMTADFTQYRNLNEEKFNDMFDRFTLALADPLYAKRVFNYIIYEINKSTTNARIDEVDLNVPRQEDLTLLPLPIPQQHQPRPLTPLPGIVTVYKPMHPPIRLQPRTPTPVPMNGRNGGGIIPQQPGIYPLKYKGQTIEGRDANGVFYDIYYSFNGGNGISLMRFNHEVGEYEDLVRYFVREMYVSGKIMTSHINGRKLSFNIDRNSNELIVYQDIDTPKGIIYTQVERVPLVETPPQPAQTHSNARNSKVNMHTPVDGNNGNNIQRPAAMHQLLYNGQFIQAHDEPSGVLYDILYSLDSDGRIELFKFNRITSKHDHMKSAVTREMYTGGGSMKSRIDSTQLYFRVDTFQRKLIVQKVDAETQRYAVVETVPL